MSSPDITVVPPDDEPERETSSPVVTDADGFVRVCHVRDLKSASSGHLVTIGARPIALFQAHGKVHALDSKCYHAGGPLHMGDIEDIKPGTACVVCPWHRYRISLETGEGFFHSFDPYHRDRPSKLCSKGPRQRTHRVRVDSDGHIHVALNTSGDLPSDHYIKDL